MPKNILICFDGTSNKFSNVNTNVVRLMQLRDRQKQVACYDPGVGAINLVRNPLKNKAESLLEQAFGYGIKKNVFDGYKFLMRYYNPGDKVYIFGFSRGAFTARTLAGMLARFGLLEDLCYNLIPSLSALYFKKQYDQGLIKRFKETFCKSCTPYFVGVWDTVKSLGYFFGKSFPNEVLHHEILFGYHAVAIDEKRKKFKESLWDEKSKAKNQTIEQVWFSGVHADIGGGYPERGLSDITLLWLLTKAEERGVLLVPNWQETLTPEPLAPMHNSRKKFWRLWPAYNRPIPEKSLIAKTVVQRIEGIQTYNPKLPQKYKVVPLV